MTEVVLVSIFSPMVFLSFFPILLSQALLLLKIMATTNYGSSQFQQVGGRRKG